MALTKAQMREAMRRMGRVGARRRVETTTPDQRTEWARAAGRARQKERRKALREAKLGES